MDDIDGYQDNDNIDNLTPADDVDESKPSILEQNSKSVKHLHTTYTRIPHVHTDQKRKPIDSEQAGFDAIMKNPAVAAKTGQNFIANFAGLGIEHSKNNIYDGQVSARPTAPPPPPPPAQTGTPPSAVRAGARPRSRSAMGGIAYLQ